jgi:predicted amidohydrolase YtcJ
MVQRSSYRELRHMVLHNHFIRDDMWGPYENIVALVEPTSPCQANGYVTLVGEENRGLFKRWKDLSERVAHLGLNSDWPYTGFHGLNPMRKIYGVVTGRNGFDHYEASEPCLPPIAEEKRVGVREALRMMTVEAAYAMHREEDLGSIEKGKLADLVVLSGDPLEVDPETIKEIKVMMTMVDGKIEFLHPEWGCPGDFDQDGDVDGFDASILSHDPNMLMWDLFSSDFGRADCRHLPLGKGIHRR